jgi:hypothetical protein
LVYSSLIKRDVDVKRAIIHILLNRGAKRVLCGVPWRFIEPYATKRFFIGP